MLGGAMPVFPVVARRLPISCKRADTLSSFVSFCLQGIDEFMCKSQGPETAGFIMQQTMIRYSTLPAGGKQL